MTFSQWMPVILIFDLALIPLSPLIMAWRRRRDIRRFGAPRYQYRWYAAAGSALFVMASLGPASSIFNPHGNTPVFLATEVLIFALLAFALFAFARMKSRPR